MADFIIRFVLQIAKPKRAGIEAVFIRRSGRGDCCPNTQELWGCAEGLSIVHFNKKKMNQWIKDFPGALNDTGDIPRIRRDRYDCLIRSEDD